MWPALQVLQTYNLDAESYSIFPFSQVGDIVSTSTLDGETSTTWQDTMTVFFGLY
jgi:hypothetical protein